MQDHLTDSRTREEILAENGRLKEALLRRRSHSPMWPVVLGLLVHIVLRPLLDPWLNASSDARVGAATAILFLPIVYSGVMLVRALRPRPE